MAGQRGGLPLLLLLLTLAVPRFLLETSALLPTTDSTTTAIVPSSRPGTGTSDLERSSTSMGNDNTSPPTPPSTTPAQTAASSEPLTTLSDTTEDPNTSITLPRSSPTSGQTAGTMAKTTPAISTPTLGTTLGTLTEPATPSAATGASHLFLSLRITIPLDLGNTTVQELVLSKLRQDLQTAFPCAGLAVEWRGQRRT
ncbi:mucin-7-like isoform X2 [Indicator indicator]|uniref:mucin-7-like isoform X2 n=1 Tax=Indicator indicator TaxID=1002788 RepID=UPI0023DE6F64|nr:mucin-7-like isoform X2 [Indicator indicator]